MERHREGGETQGGWRDTGRVERHREGGEIERVEIHRQDGGTERMERHRSRSHLGRLYVFLINPFCRCLQYASSTHFGLSINNTGLCQKCYWFTIVTLFFLTVILLI